MSKYFSVTQTLEFLKPKTLVHLYDLILLPNYITTYREKSGDFIEKEKTTFHIIYIWRVRQQLVLSSYS